MNEIRKNILLTVAGLLVCIISVGIFIYPGMYEYKEYRDAPMKINRITGHAEVYTMDGWVDLADIETETSPAQ